MFLLAASPVDLIIGIVLYWLAVEFVEFARALNPWFCRVDGSGSRLPPVAPHQSQ